MFKLSVHILTALATLMFGLQAPQNAPTQVMHNDGVASAYLTNSVQESNDDMPDNPQQDLPNQISDEIPADSTVVSEQLATDAQGTVYDIETGEKVTDPQLVGTPETPADPLAKTQGKNFVPVALEEVKEKVESAEQASSVTTNPASRNVAYMGSSVARAKNVALQGNQYGAHWGIYKGTDAFYDYRENVFVHNAKGVIDVSEWQGNIDWNTVKATGNVKGVIVRLGFGWNNPADKQAKRNISELKRLKIPFGIYWYSYAANGSNAVSEANSTASTLKSLGVKTSDLSYPIFYDLERWSWKGHTVPTSPSAYEKIVDSYFSTLSSKGWKKYSVYSYTSYLNSSLKSSKIWKKVQWVAQYGAQMGFTSWNTNFRGWQYSSQAQVNGIRGSVDVNAFGNPTTVPSQVKPSTKTSTSGTSESTTKTAPGTTSKSATSTSPASKSATPQSAAQTNAFDIRKYPAVYVPDGEYYMNTRSSASLSIEVANSSKSNGAQIRINSYKKSSAQKFKFERRNDGTYKITNINSGKSLDVYDSGWKNGQKIQQWSSTNAPEQHWTLRDLGDGYALQPSIGNWVLNIQSGKVAPGTKIELHTPSGSATQKFYLASASAPPAGKQVRLYTKRTSNRLLDVRRASSADKTAIQLEKWKTSQIQLFTLKEVGNGTYVIYTFSGKVLDVKGNSQKDNTPVIQYPYHSGEGQQWVVVKNTDNSYSFQSRSSGKYLYVNANNTGTPLKIHSAKLGKFTTSQKWTVSTPSSSAVSMANFAWKNRNSVAAGSYKIKQAKSSRLYLDVFGGLKDNKVNIWIYTSNSTYAQKWVIEKEVAGYVSIKNRGSGKYMAVTSGKGKAGSNISQLSTSSDARKWIAVKQSDGTIRFYSKLNKSVVLGTAGNGKKSKQNVQLVSTSNATCGWRLSKIK